MRGSISKPEFYAFRYLHVRDCTQYCAQNALLVSAYRPGKDHLTAFLLCDPQQPRASFLGRSLNRALTG